MNRNSKRKLVKSTAAAGNGEDTRRATAAAVPTGLHKKNLNTAQRNTAATRYFITITLSSDSGIGDHEGIYDTIREDFLEYFTNVISYCISIEKSFGRAGAGKENRNPKPADFSSAELINIKYHLHAYLEFKFAIYFLDIRNHISACFPDFRFDVQTVKQLPQLLRYISKEDVDVLTNISGSKLSFFYQTNIWSQSRRNFTVTDSYVTKHRNCYKFLERFHNETSRTMKYGYIWPWVFNFEADWCFDLLEKYLHFITTGHYHKKKHILLHGESDVGKTYICNFLLRDIAPTHRCVPGHGDFFLENLNKRTKVIIFDEFSISNYPISKLRLLMAGDSFALKKKYCMDLAFEYKHLIIFITNELEQYGHAFLNRVHIIHADCPSSSNMQLAQYSVEEVSPIGEA